MPAEGIQCGLPCCFMKPSLVWSTTHEHSWADPTCSVTLCSRSSGADVMGTSTLCLKVKWHLVSLSIHHLALLIHLLLCSSLSHREDHVERRQHHFAAECVQLGQRRLLPILPFRGRNVSFFVLVSQTVLRIFMFIEHEHCKCFFLPHCFENKSFFLTALVCVWTYSTKCFYLHLFVWVSR